MPRFLIQHRIVDVGAYPLQFLNTYGPTAEECTWTKQEGYSMKIPAHKVPTILKVVKKHFPDRSIMDRLIRKPSRSMAK